MTNLQLSFRGIRSSKFRHVYGNPAKKEKCYENIKITKNAHDSHFCAVNPKFVAIVTEVAGGGAFLVLPIEKTGRIDINAGKVTGHRGPVLDLKWNPFNDNVIASCSDDCTVKLWYIPDGGLSSNLNEWLIDLHGHKRRVGYIEWHPTAENILLSAGFDHLIIVWNISRGEAVNVIDCHPDAIYSMSFNRDGSLLATTCKDKRLRIIEPRRGEVLQEAMCHTGTKACKVVYLGDTGRLFTTGFSRHSDRQYAVWSQNDLSTPLRMETIDSSSGVMFPYYDHDTRIVFLAGKGDGNVRYYEIVEEAPWVHYLNHFISGSPQRGLGIMPKRGCDVNQCEIFRFYKLHATKGTCEPISMIVPRKSDQFQDDLFPDTAAPTPSITAEEWISGKNQGPVLISMRTGVTVRTHKPVVYKPSEHTLITADRNNERKFAFLSQETIPDYRPVEDSDDSEELSSSSLSSEENNDDNCPVEILIQVDVDEKNDKNKPIPDQVEKTKKINDIIRLLEQQFRPDYEPLVSTPSPPNLERSPKLSAIQEGKFQKIQQMWGNRMNQTNISHGHGQQVLDNDIPAYKSSYYIQDKEIEIIDAPKDETELQKVFKKQAEEIKKLKSQLVTKEKRIKELEEQLRHMKASSLQLIK